MTGKLDLDPGLIDGCRQAAGEIAAQVSERIAHKTTVSVERTVTRLLGVDGANELDAPLPNVLVDHVRDRGELGRGIAYWLGNAMLARDGQSAQQIAEAVDRGELDLCALAALPGLRDPAAHPLRVRAAPGRDLQGHGRAPRDARAPGREPAAASLRAHRDGQRL